VGATAGANRHRVLPSSLFEHPAAELYGNDSAGFYGSCRSLPWHFVCVGVPSLVGLPGAVLVAASPESPGVAVRLVASGFGDDGAAEVPEQLRYGDGDQFQDANADVRSALEGGGHGEERAGGQADRGPAVPGATATLISFASGTGAGVQYR
jgi:hypothetical protein